MGFMIISPLDKVDCSNPYNMTSLLNFPEESATKDPLEVMSTLTESDTVSHKGSFVADSSGK
jgi:hypothetical protein